MSVGSVNLPGVLSLGNLPQTTAVIIGRGGAITVDNSGTSGAVSVAGAPAFTGPLNLGTNPLTCGALSSGAIAATGAISCGANPLTCGALSSGAIAASGAISCGTSAATCGALSSGAITASGPIGCGALTCGALASGAHTVSGSLSSGTNPLTCGALSCTSVASAGNVTQPRYSLRVRKTANQTLSNATITAVPWDAVETAGGGAINWPFTPPSSVITVPVNGRYLVEYTIVFTAVATSYRDTWIELNVGSPSGTRRYGEDAKLASATAAFGRGVFTYQFTAGDTLLSVGFQNSGGNLDIFGPGNSQVSSLSITRLGE